MVLFLRPWQQPSEKEQIVLGVVAIFSYQLVKADKNFADAGVKLVTLSNYSELIHLAQEEGYITPEGLDLLKRFKEDQENWQNV